jgi:hypothetical protein
MGAQRDERSIVAITSIRRCAELVASIAAYSSSEAHAVRIDY